MDAGCGVGRGSSTRCRMRGWDAGCGKGRMRDAGWDAGYGPAFHARIPHSTLHPASCLSRIRHPNPASGIGSKSRIPHPSPLSAPRPAAPGRLPPSPQQRLRDRRQLHVRRPLVDRADLRVAVELLDRKVLGVAVAAEQLQRAARSRARTPATRRASPSPPPSRCRAPRPSGARRCTPSAARPRVPSRPARAGTARPGNPRAPCRTAGAP